MHLLNNGSSLARGAAPVAAAGGEEGGGELRRGGRWTGARGQQRRELLPRDVQALRHQRHGGKGRGTGK